MTTRLEDFDFESTCQALQGVSGRSPAESRDPVEVAAYALHFLFATGQLKVFREYLRDVKEPANPPVHIEHEFTGMQQATAWLHGQPPPALETRVKVAGKTHAVWRDDGGTLRLVPAPSLEELEE